MIALNLNIKDEAFEKVMNFLNSLPKSEIQIVRKDEIEEIDPTKLPKDDFDYMSRDELDELDRIVQEAKESGFKNLKNFDELKNEV